MAESRPLEETINQLNEFYRAIGQVIIAHQGKLMTFLGDALMATFGAQGHDEEAPMKAVMAALRMHERLGELNALWEKSGKPPIRIGVGINTGEVMVGDVGFTGHHEFAAMGDNTNLAARLEKLTREYNSAVLISGSTYNHVQLRILARHIGSTQVKGRRMPVEVYEVQGIRGE
jgi:adenylate cyclase